MAVTLFVVGSAVALVAWIVGIVNYVRLAKAANLTFLQAWYSFAVYRYALNEARGTRASKLMFGGFGVMIASLLVIMVVANILA